MILMLKIILLILFAWFACGLFWVNAGMNYNNGHIGMAVLCAAGIPVTIWAISNTINKRRRK